MDEEQAKERIQLIQEMIEGTKRIVAGYWMFFMTWGIVIILAVIGMYALVYLEKENLIWINWVVFVTIGLFCTVFYVAKQEKTQETKTYPQVAVASVGEACAVSFILAGFIFPALGLYSWDVIPVLISLVAGILVFVIGGIFEWNLLKWCGGIWWLGSLGMALIHENYRALLFIPLVLVGYIMPALVLRRMYKNQ